MQRDAGWHGRRRRAAPWTALAVASLLASGCAAPSGPGGSSDPSGSASSTAGLPPSTGPAGPAGAAPGPEARTVSAASWQPGCGGPGDPFVLRIMASVLDIEAGRTDAFAWVQEDGAVIDLQGALAEAEAAGNGTTLLVQGAASGFQGIAPAEACQRLRADLALPAPAAWRNLTFTVQSAQRHRLPAADLANLTALLEEEFFALPHDASQTGCRGAGYGRWTVRAGGRVHDVLTECVDGNPDGDDEAAARLAALADKVGEILQRAT